MFLWHFRQTSLKCWSDCARVYSAEDATPKVLRKRNHPTVLSISVSSSLHRETLTCQFPNTKQHPLTPQKPNMTGWKIHHEWRCISYWNIRGFSSSSFVSFQGCVTLLGGGFKYFLFSSRSLGKNFTHFDLRIFFKWVGEKPPTSSKK